MSPTMACDTTTWFTEEQTASSVNRNAVLGIVSKYERYIGGGDLLQQFMRFSIELEENRREVLLAFSRRYGRLAFLFFHVGSAVNLAHQHQDHHALKQNLSKARQVLDAIAEAATRISFCRVLHFWHEGLPFALDGSGITTMGFDRYKLFCTSDLGIPMTRELGYLYEPSDDSMVWPSSNNVEGMQLMTCFTENLIKKVDLDLESEGHLNLSTKTAVTLWTECLEGGEFGFAHVTTKFQNLKCRSAIDGDEESAAIVIPGVGRFVFVPENPGSAEITVPQEQSRQTGNYMTGRLPAPRSIEPPRAEVVLDNARTTSEERTTISETENVTENNRTIKNSTRVAAAQISNTGVVKVAGAGREPGNLLEAERPQEPESLNVLEKSAGCVEPEPFPDPDRVTKVRNVRRHKNGNQMEAEKPTASKPKKKTVVDGINISKIQSNVPEIEKLAIQVEEEASLNSGWTHCDAGSRLDRPTSGRVIESEVMQRKKVKVKTRGDVQKPLEDNEDPDPPSPEIAKKKLIFTDATHYATCRTFFPLPGQKEKERPVRWDAFRAMLESEPLCFKFVSLKGVANTFERPAMDGQQKVRFVIHQPHTFILQRNQIYDVRTRLRQLFNWEAEDFEFQALS